MLNSRAKEIRIGKVSSTIINIGVLTGAPSQSMTDASMNVEPHKTTKGIGACGYSPFHIIRNLGYDKIGGAIVANARTGYRTDFP